MSVQKPMKSRVSASLYWPLKGSSRGHTRQIGEEFDQANKVLGFYAVSHLKSNIDAASVKNLNAAYPSRAPQATRENKRPGYPVRQEFEPPSLRDLGPMINVDAGHSVKFDA